MFRPITLLCACALLTLAAAPQTGPIITTIAGGGPDQLPLLETQLFPCSLSFDGAGDLFVSGGVNRVFRIDALGIVHPFVGSGGLFPTSSGLGEPSAQSGLIGPCHAIVDGAGNLFVSEPDSYRVLMRSAATGAVTTFAGTGVPTGSIDGEGGKSQDNLGDGKPATKASFVRPEGLAFDPQGDLLIADSGTHRVRRVSRATGVITTVAGVGTPGLNGDGGPGIAAELHSPADVASDAAGNVLIADTVNGAIRRVETSTGIITTVAGHLGLPSDGDDGIPAVDTYLHSPSGVSVDAQGNILITDTLNHRVRRVSSATGIISRLAGTGVRLGAIDGEGGFAADDFGEGGPATAAALDAPRGAAFDAAGNLLIADGGTALIRKVDHATGNITTLSAGAGSTRGDGHPATHAYFQVINAVTIDQDGNVFIADNQRVRRADAVTRLISTAAGCQASCSTQPGVPATEFELRQVSAIALDRNGDLLVADLNAHRIFKVDNQSGLLTLVAGNGSPFVGGDGGQASAAAIGAPRALATNNAGDIFILHLRDFGGPSDESYVRRVDGATGIISTVAGGGTLSADGIPATMARLFSAEGLAVDPAGNLYISQGASVRKVDAVTGLISTVAGKPTGSTSSNAKATLGFASGLAVDSTGGLLIADRGANKVQRLDLLKGMLAVVAGSGVGGFFGEGGLATKAGLSSPVGVAIASNGDLLIDDYGNNRIRRVTPAP